MFETVPRDVDPRIGQDIIHDYPDQMVFIRSAKERYEIASQDKVVRIIMDYILTNPGIHDSVFTEFRCLRCE